MKRVAIGFLGAGVVGTGVLEVLHEKRSGIEQATGCEIVVKRVLVRDPNRPRTPALSQGCLTTRPSDVLDDPEIQVVVELMGGEEPAHTYIQQALERGKQVVTANKEVIAKHGNELLQLANEKRVNLFFEASVGGAIPIVQALRRDLVANAISEIQAIINGTTNYILTDMEQGHDFEPALRQAQALGYAEPDPANDIDAHDAAYKLAILSTLAFRSTVSPYQVYREGISKLEAKDFRYAQELGYTIKLVAHARLAEDGIEVAVTPMLLPREHQLAAVKGVFNAVLLSGDQFDKLMLYGRGAGARPTASAVVSDLCAVVRNLQAGVVDRIFIEDAVRPVKAFGDTTSRHYFRLSVADRPGVLAGIARVLGEHQISISTVIQKETDEGAGLAELVIMTHAAPERRVEEALRMVSTLSTVNRVCNDVRVGGK